MTDIVARLRVQFDAEEMRPTQPVTVECQELEQACAEIESLRLRLAALRELQRESEEMGLYENVTPKSCKCGVFASYEDGCRSCYETPNPLPNT